MLGNLNTPYQRYSPSSAPKYDADMYNRDFKNWTSQNHYRTSYRDMHKKWPQKPKSYAIPGYGGYIPGAVPDNNFAKSYSKISRDQFNRQKYLPSPRSEFFPNRPATMEAAGRTLGKFGGGLHDEYHNFTRLHGGNTVPKEHPNYSSATWETTSRSTYFHPEQDRAKIARTTNTGFWKKVPISDRPRTQSSGFVQNSNLFDGHGWLPVKELHGDNKETTYRAHHNPVPSFHPRPLTSNTRKLKPAPLSTHKFVVFREEVLFL